VPELPEVETVARELDELLANRTFTGATVYWSRTLAHPSVDEFQQALPGRRVLSVARRGKYVVLNLDRGYLLVHLKMSGRLRVCPGGEPLDKHIHAVLTLDDGRQLCFHDVRKFGRMYLVSGIEEVTTSLGPEPLDDDFSLDDFCRLLERRSGRLKSLLLNQEFLAGVGNIYADESLFAARLHPLRKADSLSPDEQARLYHAIRSVLCRAVESRGTTLDDGGYRDASGRSGAFQAQIAVYGRTGLPCLVCDTPVERLVLGGRSTHFCPQCQS
jgi:formamidopyrimidine-DNA glycosylase